MESKQDKTKTRTLRNQNDDLTVTLNNISNVETESSQSSNIDVKQEISECSQNPQIQDRPNLDVKKVTF